jgi:hypothetical protein
LPPRRLLDLQPGGRITTGTGYPKVVASFHPDQKFLDGQVRKFWAIEGVNTAILVRTVAFNASDLVISHVSPSRCRVAFAGSNQTGRGPRHAAKWSGATCSSFL